MKVHVATSLALAGGLVIAGAVTVSPAQAALQTLTVNHWDT